MESIKKKYAMLMQMLATFDRAIIAYGRKYDFLLPVEQKEDLMLGLRAQVIQSFEYCTDHIWKYMKLYLEQVKNVTMETTTPSDIVRHAMKFRFINEAEAEAIIAMIKIRNQTSHIYKEEFADFTGTKAPEHYKLMCAILEKMKPS